jgi:hypothetical protein
MGRSCWPAKVRRKGRCQNDHRYCAQQGQAFFRLARQPTGASIRRQKVGLRAGAIGQQVALPIAAFQELLPSQRLRIDFPAPRQVALRGIIAILDGVTPS